MTRSEASTPSLRGSRVTPCQSSRKRMKSALDDRLDLGAQRADRVAMDARQQAPLAPFELLALLGA